MPRQRAESRHGKDHIIVVWPKVPISFSLCQRDVRCLRMLFGRRDLNAQKTSALVIFLFSLSFSLYLSVGTFGLFLALLSPTRCLLWLPKNVKNVFSTQCFLASTCRDRHAYLLLTSVLGLFINWKFYGEPKTR